MKTKEKALAVAFALCVPPLGLLFETFVYVSLAALAIAAALIVSIITDPE